MDAKDYVEQAKPVGTSADNPIEYTEGVPLINNAFYRVDGVIKVHMFYRKKLHLA